MLFRHTFILHVVALAAVCGGPLLADGAKVSGEAVLASCAVTREGNQRIYWVQKHYESIALKQVDLGFPPSAKKASAPNIRKAVIRVLVADVTAKGIGPSAVVGYYEELDPEDILPPLNWTASLVDGRSDSKINLIVVVSQGSSSRMLLFDMPTAAKPDLEIQKPKMDYNFVHLGGISRIATLPRREGVLVSINPGGPRISLADYFFDYKTMGVSKVVIEK